MAGLVLAVIAVNLEQVEIVELVEGDVLALRWKSAGRKSPKKVLASVSMLGTEVGVEMVVVES